jgi:hypothetical protein
MSELPPPEPTFPPPPRRKAWNVWGTMASAMLHVGVLVFLIWQPPPTSADAAPPAAIDVVLVPPPEAVSASEPPEEEPEEPPTEEPDEDAPSEEPDEEPQQPEEPEQPEQPEEQASAATTPPAESTPVEPPPPAPSAAPAQSAAENASPETPSEPAAPETASEPSTTEASQPVRGAETSSAKVAPIPLSRPRVRGLTAQESAPEEAVSAVTAVTADTGEVTEGTAPPAPSDEPDVATLELGEVQSAENFYFEAMLSVPSMARAREMLETLPPEKRLAQTCIIEALAQVGNAGQGFAPDVVMAEAYARLETTGTRLEASGAIFRSGEKWYGLAFDCTLSDDLTSVTAFSYRLGADVTDAVLARLSKT